MIISIETEKAFGKIQHPFMIKKKTTHQSWYLNIVKVIYDKVIADIMLNDKKLNTFPLKSRTRQGASLWPVLFNIIIEVLATTGRNGKGIPIVKEEVNCHYLQMT